jgi:hypothetical protein
MMRRNLAIAVLLALAWLIGTADRRTFAQEKSAPDTRAEAPGAKAAAHATEGQEGPPGAPPGPSRGSRKRSGRA